MSSHHSAERGTYVECLAGAAREDAPAMPCPRYRSCLKTAIDPLKVERLSALALAIVDPEQ